MNDAKFTWCAKAGQVSHAEKIERPGNTVCGLKIGKRWIRAEGKDHPVYKEKCSNCKTIVKKAMRSKVVVDDKEKEKGGSQHSSDCNNNRV